MNNIKYLIFDIGGVIMQSGTTAAISKIAQLFSLPEESIKFFLAENSEYGAKYRKGEITQEEFWTQALKSWNKTYDWQILNDLWIKSYTLRADVWKIVKNLYQNGYILGILSNTVADRFEYIKTQIPVDEYFRETVLSYKDNVIKPHQEAFELILKKLNIYNPKEAVYIDDKEIHVNIARSAGMYAIVYKDATQLEKELREMGVQV